jgi:hypothetical protein
LDSHPGPGFPNVWPQQMQQPFRPRSGAGMTPTQSQVGLSRYLVSSGFDPGRGVCIRISLRCR